MATAVLLAGACGGVACQGLLDIDGIEFGDVPAGGSGGSSAGGSGASAGAGGNGSGGIGGTPAPSPEDCSNGIDDNDDGLADCMDPLCVCAELPSTDWSGPAVFYRGAPGTTPGCPADWPSAVAVGFAGTLTADPATCTSCSCGNPSGIGCPPSPITFYKNPFCNGTPTIQTPTSSCTVINGAANGFLSAQAPVPTASGGQCTASGGIATVPPPEFSEQAVLCEGANAGSCASGSCVPLPPAPYPSSVCIYKTGSTACPAPYTEQHDLHQTIDDTRGCSACSCATPTGATCTGTTVTFDGPTNGMCMQPTHLVVHDNTCEVISTPGSMDYTAGNAQGGSCSHSGGTPKGSASGSGTLRVCCLP